MVAQLGRIITQLLCQVLTQLHAPALRLTAAGSLTCVTDQVFHFAHGPKAIHQYEVSGDAHLWELRRLPSPLKPLP